jgi:16S rRNA (adenine1518-N6/adenine1519-N6)-dimethyltransferase
VGKWKPARTANLGLATRKLPGAFSLPFKYASCCWTSSRCEISCTHGPHQVVDSTPLERMVGHAELSRDDMVLEIGAGIGNLTLLLAARAGRVIAVERDRKLVKVLGERLKGHSNVELLRGDALRIELPKFNKVVANLPHGIFSDITFRLLEQEFELTVLMYQREFAERLVAKPGFDDYSRLTVNAYYHSRKRRVAR